MKKLLFGVCLLAAVGVAQATQPADVPKRKLGNDCIFISQVNSYQALDRDKIVIFGPGSNNAYLVELSMPLMGLEGSWQMATIDRDGDGRLCGFSRDRIGVRDIGSPEYSSIRSMSRLDIDELRALEEKYNVQLVRKSKSEASQETES
ncbi:MAG TPA: DUF6491 family protein [Steroidobacteraceae bacterium]